jgi:nucleotide-binding universal stress UspA family protein
MTSPYWIAAAMSRLLMTGDAAVIVSGSRGRSGVTATVLGSVSSGLVHNAHTPALIVGPVG